VGSPRPSLGHLKTPQSAEVTCALKKEVVWDLHVYLQMSTSTLAVSAPVIISENLVNAVREFKRPIKQTSKT